MMLDSENIIPVCVSDSQVLETKWNVRCYWVTTITHWWQRFTA